jgi:glycosyltransferase involved in cell wall biosynthesis
VKVLLTVHQFFPEHSSGTEVLTLETARELRRCGHEVLIVTGAYSPTPVQDAERFDTYEVDGFTVHRFIYSLSPIRGEANYTKLEYLNGFFSDEFGRLLDASKPDIVHFFHLLRLSVTFVDECKVRNIPMVMTPTDFWMVCPYAQLMLPDGSPCQGPTDGSLNCIRHFMHSNRASSWVSRLGRRMPDVVLRAGMVAFNKDMHLKHTQSVALQTMGENARAVNVRLPFVMERLNMVDRVLVPTKLMGEVLTRYGMCAESARSLPFGINLDYMDGSVHRPNPKLRIGFIGTLSPHKGAHVLVDAVRSLPIDAPIELNLYGKLTDFGDYVADLRRRMGDDKRIAFKGTFKNPEIGEVFADLDVLVVPSLWYENTPLVIYSAQAGGCPVIASDFAGMSEVIHHEDNGLLFPAGNTAALAAALSRLQLEKGLIERLRSNARKPKSIAEYAEAVVSNYDDLVTRTMA